MKKVYRSILISAIAISTILFFTRYAVSFDRLLDSIRDFITALIYWFKVVFLLDNTYVPTVNTIPDVDLGAVLGIDVAELVRKLEAFPGAFFTAEIFAGYNQYLILKLTSFMRVVTVLLPVSIVLYLVADLALMVVNNRYGKKTKPLQVFLKITTKPYRATKKFLKGFISFASGSRYVTALVWLWLLNLNVLTMIVGIFAFYFYFAAAVTFSELPQQFVKLLIDTLIMFSGLPFVIWCLIGYKLVDAWRRSVGLDVLRHNEAKNRGFLKDLPPLILMTGTVGSKKTTTVTDMTLTYDVIDRDRALEGMRKYKRHFVNFPWTLFEQDLKKAIASHKMWDKASAELYVWSLEVKFRKNPVSANLFGYNLVDNALEFDDALTVKDIWHALEEYAKLYLIYVTKGSICAANYSIRFDMIVDDKGNFPLYDSDFFSRDSYRKGDESTFAHIIDFETLRLGKTVIDNNIKRGSFSWGTISLIEISKERLNQYGTDEMKMNSLEANQKNDGFNEKIEIIRHGATVDHNNFARLLCDAQRPDSLNAGLRQLMEIINIKETSPKQLAMPAFVFEDMIHDLIMPGIAKLLLKLDNVRGDRTLIGWILDQIHSKFENYYERVYNTYSFFEIQLELENGLDGSLRSHPYYLASKKIYPDRFATDAQGDYIDRLALRSGEGIGDAPTYCDVKATVDELRRQNSYFFKRMDDIENGK